MVYNCLPNIYVNMEKKQETVLIRVTKGTWKELNHRKEAGDSFEDVIREIINAETRMEA